MTDLQLVQLTHSDFNQSHKFLVDDFLVTEPLNLALNVTAEQTDQFFKDFLNVCLEDPISYGYKTQNNQIVAARFSYLLERPKETLRDPEGESGSHQFPEYGHRNIDEINEFVGELEDKIWEKVPSYWNRVMSVGIISVSQAYTRRGLGVKLINHNLEQLKELGCQGIVAEAIAYKSQQLFINKLGYEPIFEILHKDWLDENGKRVFNCTDETDRGILTCKEL